MANGQGLCRDLSARGRSALRDRLLQELRFVSAEPLDRPQDLDRAAGLLDSDPGIKPARSIFWDSRAPWYENVGDLPQYAEWPDA